MNELNSCLEKKKKNRALLQPGKSEPRPWPEKEGFYFQTQHISLSLDVLKKKKKGEKKSEKERGKADIRDCSTQITASDYCLCYICPVSRRHRGGHAKWSLWQQHPQEECCPPAPSRGQDAHCICPKQFFLRQEESGWFWWWKLRRRGGLTERPGSWVSLGLVASINPQHARLLCSSLYPRVCSNVCPLSQWGYLTISSSAAPSPFSFNLSQHQGLFQWVSSAHQIATVLEL